MTRRLACIAILLAFGLAAACAPAEQTTAPSGPASEPAGDASDTAEPAPSEDVEPSGTLRLYTSVSQEPIDAVLAGFAEGAPDVDVELFRAPTGELNARLAAEQREGGVTADVLWLSDPLSMQQYSAQGLLAPLDLAEADAVPDEFRTEDFVGVSLLEVVIVHSPGLDPAPTSWEDLADPAYRGAVAIPDPSFAGSAFGALGWFAQAEGFGTEYYQALADNGAVQVQSPGEVLTGVAEGRFSAGMTIAFSAREAIAEGSPLEIVRPEPGAIAIYAPVGIFESSANPEAATALVDYLLSVDAQELLVGLDRDPIRTDVEGPPGTSADDRVAPDWPALFDQQESLLNDYRAAFAGGGGG